MTCGMFPAATVNSAEGGADEGLVTREVDEGVEHEICARARLPPVTPPPVALTAAAPDVKSIVGATCKLGKAGRCRLNVVAEMP